MYDRYTTPWYWHIIDWVIIGLLVVAALTAFLIPALWVKATVCGNQADAMGVQHHWEWFGGCHFETDDGRMVPEDVYRRVDVGGQDG